ncbi:glycosyltransferase family 2 protein [Candidatus Margulisiibacteriota bacterium]
MLKKKRPLKVAIFIIAYQAVRTLIACYTRIPKKLRRSAKEIYVFDDCSNDNTYFAGLGYKLENHINNLNIYRNSKNKGYGGNQKIGYKYAINKGYDVVVLLHGDVQYAPEKIPQLIKPILENKADLVMGSRMLGRPIKGGMPIWKFLGNKFLTAIENIILGLSLSEYHSGFRAYRLATLKKLPFNKLTDDFHFDTQILIEFKKRDLRIKEIPVPTHYGPESHQVNFRTSIRYGLSILQTLLKYIFSKKH